MDIRLIRLRSYLDKSTNISRAIFAVVAMSVILRKLFKVEKSSTKPPARSRLSTLSTHLLLIKPPTLKSRILLRVLTCRIPQKSLTLLTPVFPVVDGAIHTSQSTAVLVSVCTFCSMDICVAVVMPATEGQ